MIYFDELATRFSNALNVSAVIDDIVVLVNDAQCQENWREAKDGEIFWMVSNIVPVCARQLEEILELFHMPVPKDYDEQLYEVQELSYQLTSWIDHYRQYMGVVLEKCHLHTGFWPHGGCFGVMLVKEE